MALLNVDVKDVVAELPTALVRWYPFVQGNRLLFCGAEGAFTAMLRRTFRLQTTVVRMEQVEEIIGEFDYIICIACLESALNPVSVLSELRKKLAKNGVLLLGMNNRLGLRYFCGDRDPYTNRVLDGIENYCRFDNPPGRMYAKTEIKSMLNEAGFEKCKFYAVLPRLEEPVFIYADGQLPKEDLTNRLFPSYNHPQSLWLEEEPLYRILADNDMFHSMANAYLVECPVEGDFADALCVTSSLDRGQENAMITVIHEDGTVSKEAAYPEGRACLRQLNAHIHSLQAAGVPVVEGRLDNNDRYVMPYIIEFTGQVYLKELLFKDKDKFLDAMDSFREAILLSSPTHKGSFVDANGEEGETELFDKAYLDMVPLNSFYLQGKFVFFDQEFVEENCPVALVVARMINTFYAGASFAEMEKILPADALYARYGILEEKQRWTDMELAFLKKLRQEGPLTEYHKKVRRSGGTVSANRRRLKYPENEYRRMFLDIFQDADERKVILFGSGKYAREFMNLYRVRFPVYAIVDNDEKAWGKKLHGVTVQSPDILRKLQPSECKVYICIKYFYSVVEQLDAMGLWNYSIFDPGKSYAVPKVALQGGDDRFSVKNKKQYSVGYVAGVFDLFHIGHLNILRRAKEHCDYLIVGVVSDRQVREGKKVEPFVPFEERLDMVRSCRYVDEAHEIPFEHPDTDMAWKLYRFDVQFSGSDYEHDPVWLAKKKWLEERGSTMVFFPYTESTSSTKLKKLIEKKLL